MATTEKEKPGKKFRLFGDSTKSVRQGYLNAITSLEGEVEFHGRKVSPGVGLNALVLAWLDMPAMDRAKHFRRGIVLYERRTDTYGAGLDDGEETPSKPAKKSR